MAGLRVTVTGAMRGCAGQEAAAIECMLMIGMPDRTAGCAAIPVGTAR